MGKPGVLRKTKSTPGFFCMQKNADYILCLYVYRSLKVERQHHHADGGFVNTLRVNQLRGVGEVFAVFL